MESLLPSEIARLVYGYLIDEKCDAAAQLFLETSEFLKECNLALKNGRRFSTRVMGLCLVDILNLYTDAVCWLRNCKEKGPLTSSDSNDLIRELGKVLCVNDLSDKNVSRTVFFRLSLSPKRKSESHNPPEGKGGEEKPVERKEAEEKKDEALGQAKPSAPSVDEFDLNMLQTLLDNTALHERLAENINKAIDSSGEIKNPKTVEKKIIETVLHSTEADPIFDELLHMLVTPREEDATTPEDTDKENGDPTEDRLDHAHSSSQEEETAKRLEAESKLAIEGILAGNKTQHEVVLAGPPPTTLIPIDKSQVPPAIIKEVNNATASGTLGNTVVIPLSSSTPLQPIKTSNIPPIIGFLSPVQATKSPAANRGLLNKVSSVGARGALEGRRRRIIPKPEGLQLIHVQANVSDVPELTLLKKPVARTRGGLRKTGSRGVKSLTPQISKLSEDKINVVFLENKSNVKTRSMFSKRRKPEDSQTIEGEVNTELPIVVGAGGIDLEKQSNLPDDMPSGEHESTKEPEPPQEPSAVQEEPANGNTSQDARSQEQLTLPQEESIVSCEKPIILLEDPLAPGEKSGMPQDEPITNVEKSVIPQDESIKPVKVDKCNDILNAPTDQQAQSSTETAEVESENLSLPLEKQVAETCLNIETSATSESATLDKTSDETQDCSASVIEKEKELCEDGTPEQQSGIAKFKPRISLSTPRRGSHIRVLDFKTPDKHQLEVRKSHTSPKVYPKSKQLESLSTVKRELLNSPESVKGNKKKNDWDSDLRKFLSPDVMDIPTSVGLKRKNASKRDCRGTRTANRGKRRGRPPLKRNAGKRKGKDEVEEKPTDDNVRDSEQTKCVTTDDSDTSPTKQSASQYSSNENLVKQIERDVREAIGDEAVLLDNSCGKSEALKAEDSAVVSKNDKTPKPSGASCFDMEIEEVEAEKANTTFVDGSSTKNSAADSGSVLDVDVSPASAQLEKDANLPETNSTKIDNSKAHDSFITLDEVKNGNETDGVFEKDSCQMSKKSDECGKTQCDQRIAIYDQHLAATPLKLSVSPSDSSHGQITPTTKILMSHLGTSIASPGLSPHSYSNLESILITEGARLEHEKALQVAEGISKLSDPPCETPALGPSDRDEGTNEWKGVAKKSEGPKVCFSEMKMRFEQTPAKPLTPLDTPLDMTPLTKVLNSETKILSTALVTPTLPATPRPPRDHNTPHKADSLIDLTDDGSANESSQMNQSKCRKKNKIEALKNVQNNVVSTRNTSLKKQADLYTSIKDSLSIQSSPKPPSDIYQGDNSKIRPKVTKTPRIKLMPRKAELDDYLKPKPEKSFTPTASRKATIDKNEQKTKKIDDAIQNFDQGLSHVDKKYSALKTSTPKMKKVKTLTEEPKSLKKSRTKGTITQKATPGKKISPSKKTSKFHLELMKKEEQVLKECLQNAKAKLFGIDSSDSDSSDDSVVNRNVSGASDRSKANTSSSSVKELDNTRLQWTTARDRLRKLESVSMLESSDSSDDSLISPRLAACSPKGGSLSVDSKKPSSSASGFQSVDRKHEGSQPPTSRSQGAKKTSSPQKSDSSKPAREKEESCESFPTLYLSEESNLSVVSESHAGKHAKSRKSPSASSDLLKKATTASASTGSNKQSSASSSDKIASNPSLAQKSQTVAVDDTRPEIIGKDTVVTYESVVHRSPSRTVPLLPHERQAITEYLNNYAFSFTLDAEGQDTVQSKTLKLSPFLHIFDLDSPRESSYSESFSRKKHHDPTGRSPPSRERSRKRHRSESDSEDDKRKFKRFSGTRRRDFHVRRKPLSHRRDYSTPRPYIPAHFRTSPHYRGRNGSFSGKQRPSGGWSPREPREKKKRARAQELTDSADKVFASPQQQRYDSHRSSKSSESERLQAGKSFESPHNPSTSDRAQRPVKEFQRRRPSLDREDGELSDSSELQPVKTSSQLTVSEAQRKELLALMTDRSRTSLLKKVDLDHFLTLLHGEEK